MQNDDFAVVSVWRILKKENECLGMEVVQRTGLPALAGRSLLLETLQAIGGTYVLHTSDYALGDPIGTLLISSDGVSEMSDVTTNESVNKIAEFFVASAKDRARMKREEELRQQGVIV